MASAASTQRLTDVFQCPVCLDSFKDPRVLPACGHTFCRECIEQVHDNGTVSCPTCRKVSGEVEKITQISDLAKAFIVNELQQRYFKEKRKERIVHFCACCSKKAEPAKYYCNECQLYLCDSCEGQHQAGSLFAGHRTEPLDRITFCKAHESHQVSYYCCPCNEFICSGCAISKHNGHAAVDINIEAANCRQAGTNMYSEQTKLMETNKQKIREAIQVYHDHKRDMEGAEKHIRSIEEVAVIFIKQLQTQSEMIKSAQNVNRVATDKFVSKIWQKNMAIRRDQIKVSEILSEEMTDCQVIDKYQELRELDTDYDKEEDNIPVYNQTQAIGEDVRSTLSTLSNSVQRNFPGNPNAEPSPLTTASSSKRQTEQSSTHQQKRTKTAHKENDEKQQPSTHPQTKVQRPLGTPTFLKSSIQSPKLSTTFPKTTVQRPQGIPRLLKCTTQGPQQSNTPPQPTVQRPQGTARLLSTAPGPQQSTTRPQPTVLQESTTRPQPTVLQESTTRPQPTVLQESTTRPQPTVQRPLGTPKHLPTVPGPQQSTTRPQPTVQRPLGTPKHLPTTPGPHQSTTPPQPTVEWPLGPPIYQLPAPGSQQSTTPPQTEVQTPEETPEFLQHLISCPQQ